MNKAVFTYGRMNPVTVGHEKLVSKVLAEAKSQKATPMVFLSQTNDKKKNPLTYDQKIKYAQKAFGKVVIKSKAKTIMDVMKQIEQNFDSVVLVVGSDRVKDFDVLLKRYNGKEYNFKSIEVVSAGQRDPDSDGVEGMSASKMRELASDNNQSMFKKGLPKRLQRDSAEIISSIRKGMGLAESVSWFDIRRFIKKRT